MRVTDEGVRLPPDAGRADLEALNARILGLAPPQRLILAAALLEQRQPELALAIIRRVELELSAALLIAEGKLGGTR